MMETPVPISDTNVTCVEKEYSALGGLYQAIINDLKLGTPLWEDVIGRATKLHGCLKTTILAITSFLDAFQKVADSATNTRGATRDIGTALTRICLRHKAVEAKLKTFTSAILDCFVLPLQDKLEEWKKSNNNLDKEHAKEFKKARAEIKKRSSDTIRIQKKARKGGRDAQKTLNLALQDMNERYRVLEEAEKSAVRTALIEERSRFCLFVSFLKPVMDEELAMLSELTHLQEVVVQLEKHTCDPFTLPAACEQVIKDIQGSPETSQFAFHTPPSSPSSIGSRKSSMCSISSMNSSSSGSSKSHSPSHFCRIRHCQTSIGGNSIHKIGSLRHTSVSSQDSGFTSQDTLFPHAVNNQLNAKSVTDVSKDGAGSQSTSTWPSIPSNGCPMYNNTTNGSNGAERPHTISSAYEKGHHRPPLTIYTFQSPDPTKVSTSQPVSPLAANPESIYSTSNPKKILRVGTGSFNNLSKPPVPQRCSSLERPAVPGKPTCAKLRPRHTIPNAAIISAMEDDSKPVYANMGEIDLRFRGDSCEDQDLAPTGQLLSKQPDANESDGSTHSSLGSSGYGSQTHVLQDEPTVEEILNQCDAVSKYCTLPRYADQIILSAQQNNISTFSPSAPTGVSFLLRQQIQSRLAASSSGTLKRSNSQSSKPPPPVRRTLSVTSPISVCSDPVTSLPLPPPPSPSSDCLEDQVTPKVEERSIVVTDSSKACDAMMRSQNSSQSSVSSTCDSTPDSVKSITEAPERRISVAETVKTLNESHHQPASPVLLRRGSKADERRPTRVQSDLVDDSIVIERHINVSHHPSPHHSRTKSSGHIPCNVALLQNTQLSVSMTSNSNEGEFFESNHFMQADEVSIYSSCNRAISQGSGTSSQTSRKMRTIAPEEGLIGSKIAHKQAHLFDADKIRRNSEPDCRSSSSKAPHKAITTELSPKLSQKQKFMENLNAKLAQQQQALTHPPPTIVPVVLQSQSPRNVRRTGSGTFETASFVRHWITNRSTSEPGQSESLLDQIRRGTTLRKTKNVNDRSAPRI